MSKAADNEPSLERPNLVYHEAQDRMALLPNYYAWIASHFRDHVHGTVLELGCGAGFVIQNYVDRVDRVVGVDINLELIARLENGYPDGKVRGRLVDLRGDWHEIADVRADCVIALDVVEHFDDDRAFASKIRDRLLPGGKAIVKVPAQSDLYGAMDKASGHFRRYDDAALIELFASVGMHTLALRHMNPVGAWGYRRKKDRSTNYSKTFSPGKLKFVNAMIPMLALLDHVPGLKGLSLVGVFELPRDAA